jgi:SSS family solute:Na+ symporter
MAVLDWVMVAAYLAAALTVGLWFTRKASTSVADYFVAGRSLSWFVAGTSLLATTFSSDTPLVVAGISRQSGFCGHWFWLSAALGQTATVFFFARLWRRSEVMTDVEFVARRYEPSWATSALRIFRVFFDGVLLNGIVMASVTLAMAKILQAVLNLPEDAAWRLPVLGDVSAVALILVLLAGVTVLYSTSAGLYGVAYTDVVQFVLATAGSIGLAVVVYLQASAHPGLLVRLASAPHFEAHFLSFFPHLGSSALTMFTFFVYVSMIWWYRIPGNGYFVQRLVATRSERDSFFAFLWFNVWQYVIRAWPWIAVGLLSLYYLPDLADPESCFPRMISLFLPAGLKGIMVASLLGAFMSTIDTHLNWGASYAINDLYRPFLRPAASDRHYVLVSRLATLLLTAIALLLTTRMTSILGAYKYLATIFGGTGTVMIARWYWWRVNAWSEIAAIVTSLLVANALEFLLPSTPETDLFAVRLVLTIVIVALVWVLVTLWTSSATPSSHLVDFYSRLRVAGPGWRHVRRLAGVEAEPGEFTRSLFAWLCCVLFLFSSMLGIGAFLFHGWVRGLLCMVGAAVTGLVLHRQISRMRFL